MNAQHNPDDLLFDVSRCAKDVAIAHGLLPIERVSISRRQETGHQSLWGRKPHNPQPRARGSWAAGSGRGGGLPSAGPISPIPSQCQSPPQTFPTPLWP